MCKQCSWLLILVTMALMAGSAAHGFDANTDPSLVGWWKLDDGQGTTAIDSSPSGNHGTLINGPVWVDGYFNGGLQLDGTDDYVDTGWTENLENWTISIWVNSPAAPSASGTPSGPLHRENNYQFNWNHNNGGTWPGSVAANIGGWNHTTLGPLEGNTWYFLVGTFDGSAMRAYTNGELISTLNLSGTPANEGNSMKLGRHAANAQYFAGTIDDARVYNRALTLEEILVVMTGGIDPGVASDPQPAHQATDVLREISLAWTPGDFAASHNVYLGTVFEDVNEASVSDPRGVLVSEGQTDTTFDPPSRLELGQTYYWRVDEVNAPPDSTIFKGPVWSFTTEPVVYPITNVVASSPTPNDPDQGPELLVDGSGLDEDGQQHSNNSDDMWVSILVENLGDEPAVLQFDFDRVYKVQKAQIWNFNHQFEFALNFSLKDITVEYAVEPNEWIVLDDYELNQGSGQSTYAGEPIDLGGVAARSVRITATSNYGGTKYGLSEVRFYFIPTFAREPKPESGVTDIDPEVTLSWRAGREAVSHLIYLDKDEEAVADGTALIDTTGVAEYALGALDLGATYYWKVDEVNEAEAVATWEGDIWSFSTTPFIVLEDFESYTGDDGAGEAIWQAWLDGYEVAGNGSVVGYDMPPYVETEIRRSGSQSMPFFYSNTGSATTAEAEHTFTSPQDWTTSGVQTLVVNFYGTPGNTGQLYVKINGVKISYAGAAADITKAQWQPMQIDLSTVATNLASVTRIAVGVDGAGAEGTLYFDDIRLYPDAVEYITPVEPDPEGLILRYSFDEGSGTVARDTSGSGNNGTIHGSPQWVTGASGNALAFNGVSDYVSTDASLLSGAEAFTITCWLNADVMGAADRSGLVGQNDCIEYGISASGVIQIWTPNGGLVNFDWPYAEAGQWYHLAATGDGTSLRIYLDGKLVATGGSELDEDDEGYGTSTYPVNIAGGGVFDATDNWLAGQIDEVHIYLRALSAAEIASLAGLTEPIFKPF